MVVTNIEELDKLLHGQRNCPVIASQYNNERNNPHFGVAILLYL